MSRRADQRRARWRARAQAIRRPIARPSDLPDPLRRPQTPPLLRLVWGIGAAIAAAGAHGAVLLILAGAGRAFSARSAGPSERAAPVRVEIKDVTPPPPAPTPPPEAEPVPVPAPKKVAQAKPRTPKKVRPKQKAPDGPVPADPINQPTTPQRPPPKKKVRRIAGLDLGSTVTGGQGPSFAAGNTRMATSDRVAADPKAVKPIADRSPRPYVPSVGDRFEAPRMLRKVRPAYPPAYRAQNLEADVVVLVRIDAKGKVRSVRVVQPAAEPAFNEAAQRAAEQTEYEPAKKNGLPVPYELRQTFKFRITD